MPEPIQRVRFALNALQDCTAFVLYQVLGILHKEGATSVTQLDLRFTQSTEKALLHEVLVALKNEGIILLNDYSQCEITELGKQEYLKIKREVEAS